VKVTCPRCAHEWTIVPRRGQNQSNLLHKLIASYAAAVQESPAWCKVILKFQFGPWERFPFDGAPPEWPGRFWELSPDATNGLVDDTIFVYLKSESAYTKPEERAMIDAVLAQCIAADADLSWYGG